MDFYKMLSEYYDDIFCDIGDEVAFISSHISRKDDRILDVACGTGQHSVALYEMGYRKIEAIDLEPESIKQAKSKVIEINFITGSMLDLKKYYTGSFSLIFCIGNSIAHLTSANEVRMFLNDAFSLLFTGGVLILQCINYDRIYSGKVTSLPVIQKNDVKFERKYELGPEKVRFTGVLKTGKTETVSSIDLLAVRYDMLKQMLIAAGFKNTHFYGDFLKNPYAPESSYALVTWSKKD